VNGQEEQIRDYSNNWQNGAGEQVLTTFKLRSNGQVQGNWTQLQRLSIEARRRRSQTAGHVVAGGGKRGCKRGCDEPQRRAGAGPASQGGIRVADIQGTVRSRACAAVTVGRRWGVPHIYAKNQHDLFFRKAGGCARPLFQMSCGSVPARSARRNPGPAAIERDINARASLSRHPDAEV